MSRRHVKEFRPDEALILISADRDGKTLPCPSCGSDAIGRSPPRIEPRGPAGPVQLACHSCGRLVAYVDRGPNPISSAP